MTKRTMESGEVELTGLFDGTPPVGAIDPPSRRRARFWPETTPICGLTPVLPDDEKPGNAPSKRR